MNKPRILLVGDMQGKDDEGMKRVARTLYGELQYDNDLYIKAVSIQESLDKANTVDILHHIGGPTYRSVLFAALCQKKNKNLKTILTFIKPVWNLAADISIRIFKPSHVIVSSDYWKQWAKRLGIKHRFIPLSGVDSHRFCPVDLQQKNQLRQKLNLPLGKILVLHVGHLKYDRNLEVLLKTQVHPAIQVIIIGSTTTKQSGRLIHRLEKSGCRIIRDYQPKVEEFYQAVDCYIFPTTDHRAAIHIPLSVLEAMATNLPVITTQFGELPILFPSACGLYYLRPNHFDDLPSIIMSATARASDTRSLIKALSWSCVANQVKKIYFELTGD